MKINIYLVFVAALLLFTLFTSSCSKKTTEANQVATPIFDPAGGTYDEAQNVSISCATPDATIRYTTDGSNPSSSSSVYSNPISVSQNTTLKARAFKAGWEDSEIASVVYQISHVAQVATPLFFPGGGSYNAVQNVSIFCFTPGASVHYTTDGSNPDSLSLVYSSPISVAKNTTLKARAFKEGWSDSEITNANYDIILEPTEMIYVSGGTFHNGTSDVTLSSFYISKYETTQAEYQAVMGINPAQYNGIGDDYPVYYVSWFKAIEYCNRRSMLEGFTACYSYLDYGADPSTWPNGWNTEGGNHINVSCDWTANGYRLPTEMEWMFAAKGGNQSQGYTYSGSNNIDEVAWYYDNSFDVGSSHPDYGTHVVGTKLPNELGIYDMSGNVFEWCWDIWALSYPSGAQTNPHGASNGTIRVGRGGCWFYDASYCDVSRRFSGSVAINFSFFGFRCVRVFP